MTVSTSKLLPFVLCLCSAGPAQRPGAVDPYTKGEPEALAKCGYVSLAPFHFADDHMTRDVDQILGDGVVMRWIETRHFKIGIGLTDRPLTKDQQSRKRLFGEIKELREKLPTVPRRPRGLNGWLLAHLYAQRLEALYEDFRQRAGMPEVEQEAPGEPSDGRGWQDRGGVGKGPFLGQHGKFGLLVFERRSDLGRYMNRFAGVDFTESTSHHFLSSNSLVFVTAAEAHRGSLKAEEAMHCNVVFGVARNLVDGCHGYGYDIPAWWREGIAHWYRRNLDPRFNNFGSIPVNQDLLMEDTRWDLKVRGYVQSGAFDKAEELLTWGYRDISTVPQHRMVWSRVEYVMSLGDEKFAEFLKVMRSLPPSSQWDRILETQEAALKDVYGFDDAAAFDAAWSRHVLENYPRR